MATRKSFRTVSRGGTRISNDQPGRRSLLFNEVMAVKGDKNVFDLSHNVTMSGKMGNLIPLNVIKCVPGDIHKIGTEQFIRLAPMIAPPMHQMNCSIHHWFIPCRKLWANFEDFMIGEGSHAMPFFRVHDGLSDAAKSFLDYMGIPPISPGGTQKDICALPLAAYQYLYNEKYRDQNLISEVSYALSDGNNSTNTDLTTLRRVAWEHDLFTSALPQAAFGTDVEIPLGSVQLIPGWNGGTSVEQPHFTDGVAPLAGDIDQSGTLPNPTVTIGGVPPKLAYDPQGTLSVEPTTIKELRQALKRQEFLELLARGGKRYYEVMERLWDITTDDNRYQQPEWISGSKTPVMVSEVLNTTGTVDAPQGNMAGHGLSIGNDQGKSFFCPEYGYIISVLFVTPKSGYHQGIPKHYLEMDSEEYGNWIQYEHIGEQELTDAEIYAYNGTGEGVWGYVPRYAHLKYHPDRIAGEMRTTLDHWTMNRTFATPPSLNQTFIEVDPDDPSITRVFAVEGTEDYLYIDVWNNIRSIRPFSVFGNPQL